MSDLPDLSAGDLVALIERGETSCVEVVRAHLDRIEALNPRFNAIVGMRFDTSEIGQQLTEIVAYGTAVRVEPA